MYSEIILYNFADACQGKRGRNNVRYESKGSSLRQRETVLHQKHRLDKLYDCRLVGVRHRFPCTAMSALPPSSFSFLYILSLSFLLFFFSICFSLSPSLDCRERKLGRGPSRLRLAGQRTRVDNVSIYTYIYCRKSSCHSTLLLLIVIRA